MNKDLTRIVGSMALVYTLSGCAMFGPKTPQEIYENGQSKTAERARINLMENPAPHANDKVPQKYLKAAIESRALSLEEALDVLATDEAACDKIIKYTRNKMDAHTVEGLNLDYNNRSNSGQ